MHDSAAWYVGVAEEEMSACVLCGVSADSGHHVCPASVVSVSVVHYFDLAEVNRLDADIDIAGGEVVEPHPGFEPAHIGDGGASGPLVLSVAVRVDHPVVAEAAFFRFQGEFFEYPPGYG